MQNTWHCERNANTKQTNTFSDCVELLVYQRSNLIYISCY